MISANNVTLRVGKKALFEEVNIKFTEGNCYGLIGANGAGKSTFLKILSGQLEPTNGEVAITPGERLSFLQQDHFKYDEYPVLDTVIMGNARLYEIMKEKEAIYAKEDFTDEDGIKASELEGEFATMNGWEAESDAASLLNGLGIETDLHYKMMKDMTGPQKVKVLLAQALFGNPDILLLDEPTNHLDLDAIAWLEEFLINFENTVIVVSHDRYFLNKVCTQIADIDYGKIQLYAGNYDFWYESSQLLIRQMKEANKKKEEKIKELQDFISRFSANASKSKQATSRKRALEKIQLDEIKPSSRKYPYIDFRPNREIGNEVLTVEGLSKTIDGVKVLDNISFTLGHDDKVAFVGSNEVAKTVLFKILIGEMEPDEGTYKWGVTTSQAYFPKDFGIQRAILKIKAVGEDQIWVYTGKGGIYRIDVIDKKNNKYQLKQYLSSYYYFPSLCIPFNGYYLTVAEGKVYAFDKVRNTFERFQEDILEDVDQIFVHKQQLYLLKKGLAYLYNEKTSTLFQLTNHPGRELFISSDNQLWVSSFDGLYRTSLKGLTPERAMETVFSGNPWTTSFTEDSFGNIWIGTYRNGTFCFHKNQTPFQKSMSGKNIECMSTDHSGNYWIGSLNGEVCVLDSTQK